MTALEKDAADSEKDAAAPQKDADSQPDGVSGAAEALELT